MATAFLGDAIDALTCGGARSAVLDALETLLKTLSLGAVWLGIQLVGVIVHSTAAFDFFRRNVVVQAQRLDFFFSEVLVAGQCERVCPGRVVDVVHGVVARVDPCLPSHRKVLSVVVLFAVALAAVAWEERGAFPICVSEHDVG